jgi:DNA replication protein DnaC
MSISDRLRKIHNPSLAEPIPDLKEIISEMDAHEWGKPESNELQVAFDWHLRRLKTDKVKEVCSYSDASKLLDMFWKNRINGGFKFNQENTETMRTVLKWAIASPCEIEPNKSIWLWGQVGSGKSVFITALHDMLEYLNQSPGRVKFRGQKFDFVDMNQLFLEAKFDQKLFRNLNSPNHLIIDELRENHFELMVFGNLFRVLGDLISARYSLFERSNLRTIITTNLKPDFSEGSILRSLLDDREIDRIRQMFVSFEWKGDSLRSTKKNSPI